MAHLTNCSRRRKESLISATENKEPIKASLRRSCLIEECGKTERGQPCPRDAGRKLNFARTGLSALRLAAFSILCACELGLSAQEAGNQLYGGSRRRTSGVVTGNLFAAEPKEAARTTFIEANVLMNVR